MHGARDEPRIRPALPAEAGLLSGVAFRSKAHWGYSPAFMAACRAELTLSPAQILEHPTFVVEAPQGVLGFYALEHVSATHVDLAHLFVEPAAHGRGLGRALLTHARGEARARGYRVLVIQGDPNAVGFYEACGATLVGSRPSASIPGRALPLLEIALT